VTARRQGLLCAFGVLFIWAAFLLASRLAASQAFTPWDMAALRHAGAFLAALPLLLWRGWPGLSWRRALWLTLAAAIGFPLCAYWGFRFAPASHGAVLLPGLLPFLAAAAWWWWFGEAWSWRRTASLGLVAAGMSLLAMDTFGAHPGAWRGDLLFAAGCLSWVAYMWMVRRWAVSALDATIVVALLAAPLYLPVWWLALPSGIGAWPAHWVVIHLVQQGALSVVVAGYLFTQAQVQLGAPQTSAITSVVPVLVALGAWPLLGEALGPAGLIGVALVTLGMVAAVGRLAPRAR
jgi:drug/metabolite transporter (DMT)-like permease